VFEYEDGGDMFLQNVGQLSTDYTALCPQKIVLCITTILHDMDVGIAANVSEAHAATIFRVEGLACCRLLGRSLLGSLLYPEDGGIYSSKILVNS
jgi:hypothetical protein